MGDAWKSYAFDRRAEMNVHIRDEDDRRALQEAEKKLTEMVMDIRAGKCVEHDILVNARSKGMAGVIRDALVKKNASLAPFLTVAARGCVIFWAHSPNTQ